MKTTLRTTALALAIGLFGTVGTAQAVERGVGPTRNPVTAVRNWRAARQETNRTQPQGPRTVEQAKVAFADAAQRTGMPHFASPTGRVVFNAHEPQHLAAFENVGGQGTGVLHIMQSEGALHTKAAFDGKYIHFQFATGSHNPQTGGNNWRLRPWADRLRVTPRKTFVASIQLTPTEAQNLRSRIAATFQEEGPEHLAGNGWANGRVGTAFGVTPGPSFSCASAWCDVPIGENGESLSQLIGVRSQFAASSLQRSLETGGNEKIVGIGVLGPKVENFGQGTEQRYR